MARKAASKKPEKTTRAIKTRAIWASAGTTAWLNAAIAASQEEVRGPLYRTLSIEFFPTGVQFVGCDGTMLFRTWAPYADIGDLPAPHPEWDEAPEDTVVVSDVDKFAVGFMRTLSSALPDYEVELAIAVEPAEEEAEPPLGEELRTYLLTLAALGQRLSCKLYDGPYPDWRRAQFGLDPAERVDGMRLATRLFRSVGKLIGIAGVDCSFRGDEKAIEISSTSEFGPSLRGILMPMRRLEKPEPPKPPVEQGELAEAAH